MARPIANPAARSPPQANFHKKFKDETLLPFLWKVASTTTQPEFGKALEDMTKINPQAVPWL